MGLISFIVFNLFVIGKVASICLPLYGTGCFSNSDCVDGTSCNFFQGWSQCLEKAEYATKAQCNRLYNTGDWGCVAGSCCNPNAYCDDNRLCQLPNQCSTSKVPTVVPTAFFPTSVLTKSPTRSGEKLCQWATGCNSNDDCVLGNKCQKYDFWSQCIEDPAALSQTTCLATNSEWGCGNGLGSKECCNRFAVCTANHLCSFTESCVYSFKPTKSPVLQPGTSVKPSQLLSKTPTSIPVLQPTSLPTIKPTISPTSSPTRSPSVVPTVYPSFLHPSVKPSANPSVTPTSIPTKLPSLLPTSVPSVKPSFKPTSVPTKVPSFLPTSVPSVKPSFKPTSVPTKVPSILPTSVPSIKPSVDPSAIPISVPTQLLSFSPSSSPSA
jgi:hypothetical protein